MRVAERDKVEQTVYSAEIVSHPHSFALCGASFMDFNEFSSLRFHTAIWRRRWMKNEKNILAFQSAASSSFPWNILSYPFLAYSPPLTSRHGAETPTPTSSELTKKRKVLENVLSGGEMITEKSNYFTTIDILRLLCATFHFRRVPLHEIPTVSTRATNKQGKHHNSLCCATESAKL